TEQLLARRNLLRYGGIAAAGAAVAVVANAVEASPADAASGGPMILGAANSAGTDETSLTSDNGTVALGVSNSNGAGGSGIDVGAGGPDPALKAHNDRGVSILAEGTDTSVFINHPHTGS